MAGLVPKRRALEVLAFTVAMLLLAIAAALLPFGSREVTIEPRAGSFETRDATCRVPLADLSQSSSGDGVAYTVDDRSGTTIEPVSCTTRSLVRLCVAGGAVLALVWYWRRGRRVDREQDLMETKRPSG